MVIEVVERPKIDPLQEAKNRAVFEMLHSSPEGFGKVYADYGGPTYGFFLNRTGSEVVAEDLTSRLWLRFLEAVGKGLINYVGTPFRSYLFQAASNEWKNHIRDQSHRQGVPLDCLPSDTKVLIDDDDDIGTELAEEELKGKQVTALNKGAKLLSPDHRLALHLHYVEGLTNRETGRKMGRSEGAAKGLIHRSTRELKQSPPVLACKVRNQED